MPRAKLSITVPEEVWIGDLTRRYGDASFRILAALSSEEAGVGLVEVVHPDPVPIVEALTEYDGVTEAVVLKQSEDSSLVQFETTKPLLLFAVNDSGVPLELPFTIRDGEATWQVTASRERLSALADQFEQLGVAYTVEWIRQHFGEEPLLTDNQREVIATAVDSGYYDTPRHCTLTELAGKLDLAKSTLSETLHRAEGKIIKQFVDESS